MLEIRPESRGTADASALHDMLALSGPNVGIIIAALLAYILLLFISS